MNAALWYICFFLCFTLIYFFLQIIRTVCFVVLLRFNAWFLFQDSTINYICENLLEVCSAVTDSSDETRLKFKDEQTFLHAELSEQLLHKLCEKKLLDDLVMTLFNCESTRLKQVRFRDASKLSVKGLKTLRGHRIQELEAVGLSKATVTDLISCLGEWSLLNLRNFNVANSTFVDSNKFCVVVALAKLRNLQALNVSRTEFNRTSLELVVEDLPKLESLNISCTQEQHRHNIKL